MLWRRTCQVRRVALPGALLGFGRDRDGAAGGGDALVRVGGEGGRVHVDVFRGHEPVLVHQPDAVVVGGAPHPGVGGDGQAELAGHLEGRLLREGRVAGDVEGDLEAEHLVRGVLAEERPEGGVGGPLQGRPGCCRRRGRTARAPRAAPRRPPRRGRGYAGCATSPPWWSRLPRGLPRRRSGCPRGCPRGGTSGRAPGSSRRSTESASSPRRRRASPVCHMCRWVSIIPGITMPPLASISSATLRGLAVRSHRGDPVPGHQHVRVGEDGVGVVHGEHRAATQHDRTAVRPGRAQPRAGFAIETSGCPEADLCPLRGRSADQCHCQASAFRLSSHCYPDP